MLKIRKVVASSIAVLAFSLASPVLAFSHRGGEWNYAEAIMIQIIGEHIRIIIMVHGITGPMLEVLT